MTATTVLLIDDERPMLEAIGKLLRTAGYRVHLAADGESGARLLRDEPVQVVVTDLRMPGLDGLAVLRHVKESGADAEVILLTEHGSIDVAVTAIKQGAYDFLTKPLDSDRLLHVVQRAAEHQALGHRARVFEAAHADSGVRPLVAESPVMQRTLALVEQLAASDATVLIQGESGTGKELIARAPHARSPRRTPGKFELADGGTLFLDEVAELAPTVQAKLLRVLQEREVERLGALRPIPVGVRILAATNHDVRAMVQERRFREDLYYRLNVVTVDLPPLRHRPEDLLPLARWFLGFHARRVGKRLDGFTTDAVALVRRYRWPGNVRELEHAVQRGVILATGREVWAADLGLPVEPPPAASLPSAGSCRSPTSSGTGS